MVLCNWCWRRIGRSTVGIDGLDEDILDIDHVAFDDGVDLYGRLTLLMNMTEGIVQLEVRMANGASAKDDGEYD